MAPIVWYRFGSATTISFTTILPTTHLKDVIFWSTIAFAFAGIESASLMADEIRDAKRNIPPAILTAGALIAGFYIVATAAVLVAVPEKQVSGLQGLTQAIDAVSARIGMRSIAPFAAAMITISALGGVAAWFAAAARLPFVAGVDRFLPESFGRVHPKWGTPHVALLTQAAIALVFVFLGQAGTTVKGAYDVLVSMSVIANFIPFLLMFGALIKLDRKPVSIFLASLGFVTTTISIVLATIPAEDDPNKILAVTKTIGLSALMIAIGAAIYWNGRRSVMQAKAQRA
jgi:amino acid transporter